MHNGCGISLQVDVRSMILLRQPTYLLRPSLHFLLMLTVTVQVATGEGVA